MPTNVNCIAFSYPNTCMHPCAPKTWFIEPRCIELIPVTTDVRVPKFCELKHPMPKPLPPPSAPAKQNLIGA